MNSEIIDAGRDMSGGYKVDVSRGENVDRVSSEWFSRPDDERYLSLDDLFASVKGRAERSRTRTVESAAIRVEAHRDNPEKLGLVLPGADEPIAPTHWSFGQLSSLVGAPAAYLRQLPAPLAGINLQYGLTNHRAEQIKTMEVANARAADSGHLDVHQPLRSVLDQFPQEIRVIALGDRARKVLRSAWLSNPWRPMPHSRSSCSPSLSSVFEQPQTTKKRGGRQPRPRAALRQKAPRAASYTTPRGTTPSGSRSWDCG